MHFLTSVYIFPPIVFLESSGGETVARCFQTGSGWSGFSWFWLFRRFWVQPMMLPLPPGSTSLLKVRDRCSSSFCRFWLMTLWWSWLVLDEKNFLVDVLQGSWLWFSPRQTTGFMRNVWEYGGRRHASESKQIQMAQFNNLACAFPRAAASTCTLCQNN